MTARIPFSQVAPRTIINVLRCHLLGRRYRFTADGRTMTPTPLYAVALDRSGADDLEHRVPPLGLFAADRPCDPRVPATLTSPPAAS